MFWLLPAVAACLPAEPAQEVLPVEHVDLHVLRPGAIVTVAGSGFVPGPAIFELSGTVSEPGAPPRPWTFSVAATATSDRELVALLPQGVTDVLHGTHGRFRGTATVSFAPPAAPALPPLVGRQRGLSIPMVSEVPAAAAVRAEREDAARQFLGHVGLEVAVETEPGGKDRVTVRRVRDPRPPLDELRPGDRLVALDEIHVSSLADLAPNPDAASVVLTVAEAESGRLFDLRLDLRKAAEDFLVSATLAAFVVLGVLALVLYVHFAGFSERVARIATFPLLRRASAEPSVLPDVTSGSRWPGLLALAVTLASTVVAPPLLHRVGQDWPVLDLWTVAVAGLFLHRLAHATGDLVHARAAPRKWLAGLLGAVVSASAAALPLTASVGLVLWDTAALTASSAVAAQGSLPPAWAAMRDPFALLLVCLALASLGPSFAPGQPGWRTAADAAATVPACLLLVATGFGGWNVGPLETVVFAWLPAGAWAMLAKVLLLVGATAWYGRRRWARGRDPRSSGLAWVAALPLAAASVLLEQLVPAAWYATVVQPFTLGLLGTLVLGLWFGHRQQTDPAILKIRIDTA